MNVKAYIYATCEAAAVIESCIDNARTTQLFIGQTA